MKVDTRMCLYCRDGSAGQSKVFSSREAKRHQLDGPVGGPLGKPLYACKVTNTYRVIYPMKKDCICSVAVSKTISVSGLCSDGM